MGYRVVDASVKKEAVRLVVDKGQPVLPACETFGLSPRVSKLGGRRV